MELQLTDEEALDLLSVLVTQEAVTMLEIRPDEELASDERTSLANLHGLGHKLADMTGTDYHDAVAMATRMAVRERVAKLIEGMK